LEAIRKSNRKTKRKIFSKGAFVGVALGVCATAIFLNEN
jgi:hypothetical protein